MDTAPASFTLYDVAGKEQAIIDLLDHDWTFDGYSRCFSDEGHAQLTDIVDGVMFGDDQAGGMAGAEVGAQLQDLGVSYIYQQDAKYEWDGELRMFTPSLGEKVLDCTQGGEPYLTATQLETLAEHLETYDDLMIAIRHAYGHPWIAYFDAKKGE